MTGEHPIDFEAPNLSVLLTDLYDSEINVSLSWFWNAGIDLALGDDLNGYEAKVQVATLAEAAEWLRSKAVEHSPTACSPGLLGSNSRASLSTTRRFGRSDLA